MACEWSLSRRSLPNDKTCVGFHSSKHSSSGSLSAASDQSNASNVSSKSRSTLPRCYSMDVLTVELANSTPSDSPRSSTCSSPSRRSITSDGTLYTSAHWGSDDLYYSQRPSTPGSPSLTPALSRSNSGSFGHHHVRRVCSLSEGRLSVLANKRKDVQPSSLRRIFRAKQVLADVARIHTNNPAPASACSRKDSMDWSDSNTFALIISHLGSSTDQQQTLDYLDTLCVLAADDSSREVLVQQGAQQAVLDLLAGGSSTAVQVAALDTLACVTKGHKQQFWQSARKHILLSMLQQQHKPSVLLAAIAAVNNLALCTPGSACARDQHHGHPLHHQHQPTLLLEPAVIAALARLLGPSVDPACVTAALALLQRIAHLPGTAKLPGWRCCIFQVVSLLSPAAKLAPEAAHEAVQLLLALSDARELQSTICSAGCFSQLPALMQHKDGRLALGASCLLSSLAETGPGQEYLSEEASLVALLRALQSRAAVDVKIGALYTLRCVAQTRPMAVHQLKMHGAVQLLLKLLQEVHDEDALLGGFNLLALLGYQEQAKGRGGPGGEQHGRQHSSGQCGAGVPGAGVQQAYMSVLGR